MYAATDNGKKSKRPNMEAQSLSAAPQTRRAFLRRIAAAGAALPILRLGTGVWASASDESAHPGYEYAYRTLSVEHLPRLQEWIDSLNRDGRLSDQETFRSYLRNKRFALPEDFPEARYIVLLASFTPMATAAFLHGGKRHEIILPPQYYDDGQRVEDIEDIVRTEIIGEPGYKIQRARQTFYKTLAAYSGLGHYGRNNIIHVGDMGSFITLHAYFTDYSFPEDHFVELKMHDACRTCRICIGLCPTDAIRRHDFVVDIGKCITLYNEIDGRFPAWIPRDGHNALMGCMKCQLRCPINRKAVQRVRILEDEVSEEETRKVLDGKADEDLIGVMSRKLSGYAASSSLDYFPVFTRNLRVLLT